VKELNALIGRRNDVTNYVSKDSCLLGFVRLANFGLVFAQAGD